MSGAALRYQFEHFIEKVRRDRRRLLALKARRLVESDRLADRIERTFAVRLVSGH